MQIRNKLGHNWQNFLKLLQKDISPDGPSIISFEKFKTALNEYEINIDSKTVNLIKDAYVCKYDKDILLDIMGTLQKIDSAK